MPVAPTFQNMQLISTEPYLVGDKKYVDVYNPNNKKTRMVRWYSETEYAKLYGKKIAAKELERKKETKEWNMRKARGFSEGPILVIRNNTPNDETWLKQSIARYAVGIGWHFISTDILPEDRPPHFKYLLLGWNEFKEDDYTPKDPTRIAEILNKKYRENKFINI